MIWLLVGYMWLFIHRPFEVWPWLGEYHIERVYMVVTILYWALCASKKWTFNCVHWGVGLLAAAIVLATCASPYTGFDNLEIQNWFKILVFYVLVMSSVREERELHIMIIAFVVIMGLYELHSLREYLCGRGVYRMGTWRMVGVDSSLGDPNSFAASVNYGIPMLLPLLTLAHKRWRCVALGGLFALSCLCVMLTGSRGGFAGLALLVFFGALLTKYRWGLVVLLVVTLPLVWIGLSEKLQNRYLTLIDPSRGPANAEVSATSRLQFFWLAVDIWKEHPVFGIGPGCFQIVNEVGLQSHSLYAQTISELGTVGVIALLAVIGCYVGNYVEGRRLYRSIPPTDGAVFCYRVVFATTITMVQLMFLGLAGHDLFRFTWIWYGAFAALAVAFLRERCCREACVGGETMETDEYRYEEDIICARQ